VVRKDLWANADKFGQETMTGPASEMYSNNLAEEGGGATTCQKRKGPVASPLTHERRAKIFCNCAQNLVSLFVESWVVLIEI